MVDVSSEYEFNLNTQTKEIAGNAVAINLGRNITQLNGFKAFWPFSPIRLIKKPTAGKINIRQIILTGKGDKGSTMLRACAITE
jgi:hypothetical protein